MEVTGTLKHVEPYVQISEKFGKAGAVLTMQNGQYENDLYVEFHGKSADLLETMQIGQEYKVGINLASREWNGKYFTTAKGWKVTPVGNAPAEPIPNHFNSPSAQKTAVAKPTVSPVEQMGEDDLPF